MEFLMLLFGLLFSTAALAQHNSLPHGMVYGDKPTMGPVALAANIEKYMGNRVRVNTTIEGKVIKVTKPKGGWFQVDVGNGRFISAHFKNYNVNIPADLKGHTVIIEGVVQKEFKADDKQHIAGDTQQKVNANSKNNLTFEVKGLMVDK